MMMIFGENQCRLGHVNIADGIRKLYMYILYISFTHSSTLTQEKLICSIFLLPLPRLCNDTSFPLNSHMLKSKASSRIGEFSELF